MSGVGNDFRNAEETEREPHQVRYDQEQFPHMYHFAYALKRGSQSEVSRSFVFTARPITTPRDMDRLSEWIVQCEGAPCVLLAFQSVQEEVL